MVRGGKVNIHFWGVRGSVPTPISPQQVQSKIMAAIQRAKPEDLQKQKLEDYND